MNMKVKFIAVATLVVAIFAVVQSVQAQGLFRARFVCAGGSCASGSCYQRTNACQYQTAAPVVRQRVGFFGRIFGGGCYQSGAAYYANAYAEYNASVPPCGNVEYREEKVCVPGGCEGEYLPTDVEAPKPCAPTLEQIESPAPCDPVKVEPCEPVQTVEPCAPVKETATTCEFGSFTNADLQYSSVGTCPNGACPLRTATRAAANVARGAVATSANAVGGFLAAVNAVRAQYGLRALVADTNLDATSYRQVAFCASRQTLIHAGNVAEILAQNNSGYNTAIQQWLNSRMGHRELLLNPNFTRAGVATYKDGYGRVWCAVQFR